MITITGLTDRQRTIMDLLWGCSTLEQVQALIQAMPTGQDQVDARSLVLIATHETLEQELGLDQYADQAKDAINSARSR
jgi:hypothetical protein